MMNDEIVTLQGKVKNINNEPVGEYRKRAMMQMRGLQKKKEEYCCKISMGRTGK